MIWYDTISEYQSRILADANSKWDISMSSMDDYETFTF